jgi:hypothetical protein
MSVLSSIRARLKQGAVSRSLGDTFDEEKKRVRERRSELRAVGENADAYGLALSGGGIRSATFALGALQGMAHASAPDAADDPVKAPEHSLLARFDYLSTVSGGGYIGAFFASLFVPGRLWRGTNKRAAAEEAYRVFQQEPPGRIRTSEQADQTHVRRSALAWLRENGRYLTPVGAGDLTYALALAIRNWFSMQFVIGTFIAAAFALVLLARFGLALWPEYAEWEKYLLEAALAPAAADPCDPCDKTNVAVWWSPIFGLPLVVLAVWLVPLSIAFWLTHPGRNEDDASGPSIFTKAATWTLVLAVLSAAIGYTAVQKNAPPAHIEIAYAAAALTLLGFIWHAVTRFAARTIAYHRVVMTRGLAAGLQLFVALLVVAVVDTLSQTLYLTWARAPSVGTIASPAVLAAGAVWLFRAVARLADRNAVPSLLKRVPVGVVAGVAGMLLFLLIATLWGLAFHGLLWTGEPPNVGEFSVPPIVDELGEPLLHAHVRLLAVCFGVVLVLAIVSGRFSGFLNLSSLQSLYSARLTRAYLGGSNGERFKPMETQRDRKRLSAAEPVAGDQLTRDVYYNTLAPLHIINVTLNQTIDPAEQLVQRDRKGKPMAVLPTGFSIDRTHFNFRDDVERGIGGGLGSQKLTIGQWIGTSGAAFTTGLGRSTSLGTSIALGLANVRLGTWWSSGHGEDRSGTFERGFKGLFKTQTFLFYELMAKFHGLRREWQYLSDGGHFENTALYELLRPGRDLRVIVVCDDGCDESYQFADLANLIRLARIDFGIEVEVDRDVATHDALGVAFGTLEDFAAADARGANDKCALLLNVFQTTEKGTRAPVHCRIVVLKPRLIASAPVDVHEYAATHGAFPQEPTTDQFFDQAQWESYRRLGLAIARRVFGGDGGAALWKYLAGSRPAQIVGSQP